MHHEHLFSLQAHKNSSGRRAQVSFFSSLTFNYSGVSALPSQCVPFLPFSTVSISLLSVCQPGHIRARFSRAHARFSPGHTENKSAARAFMTGQQCVILALLWGDDKGHCYGVLVRHGGGALSAFYHL